MPGWKWFSLFLLAVLTVCSTTGTPSPQPTPSPSPTLDADLAQQEVYAALVQALYPNSELVIMDTTQTNVLGLATPEELQQIESHFKELSPGTAADFNARNASQVKLSASMLLGIPYVLLSEQAKKELFQVNQSGWDVFYNRYPQAPGIITLSQVGFNQSGDQALVYLGLQSNWLAGSGNFILLGKFNGKWIILQQVTSWIS